MKRVVGAILSTSALIGACGQESMSDHESARNPLALNVVIERQLSKDTLSPYYIAGIGYGIAELCIDLGIATSGIEDVPAELKKEDYADGYNLVRNNQLSPSAILNACELAVETINKTV